MNASITTVTSPSKKVMVAGLNDSTGKVHLGQVTDRNPFWGRREAGAEFVIPVCGTRRGHTVNVLIPVNDAVTCSQCVNRAAGLGLPVA